MEKKNEIKNAIIKIDMRKIEKKLKQDKRLEKYIIKN